MSVLCLSRVAYSPPRPLTPHPALIHHAAEGDEQAQTTVHFLVYVSAVGAMLIAAVVQIREEKTHRAHVYKHIPISCKCISPPRAHSKSSNGRQSAAILFCLSRVPNHSVFVNLVAKTPINHVSGSSSVVPVEEKQARRILLAHRFDKPPPPDTRICYALFVTSGLHTDLTKHSTRHILLDAMQREGAPVEMEVPRSSLMARSEDSDDDSVFEESVSSDSTGRSEEDQSEDVSSDLTSDYGEESEDINEDLGTIKDQLSRPEARAEIDIEDGGEYDSEDDGSGIFVHDSERTGKASRREDDRGDQSDNGLHEVTIE